MLHLKRCVKFICMENRTFRPIVRRIENRTPGKKNLILALVSITVVLLGMGTGYLLSGVNKSDNPQLSGPNVVNNKNEAGIADESTFPDTAEGVLEEGGIGGEGTHHIVRGAGPLQYAYLTSSVVDLSPFVGKKVQVWGQTIGGKKAGWLMDVGKIKVVE